MDVNSFALSGVVEKIERETEKRFKFVLRVNGTFVLQGYVPAEMAPLLKGKVCVMGYCHSKGLVATRVVELTSKREENKNEE